MAPVPIQRPMPASGAIWRPPVGERCVSRDRRSVVPILDFRIPPQGPREFFHESSPQTINKDGCGQSMPVGAPLEAGSRRSLAYPLGDRQLERRVIDKRVNLNGESLSSPTRRVLSERGPAVRLQTQDNHYHNRMTYEELIDAVEEHFNCKISETGAIIYMLTVTFALKRTFT